MPRFDRVYSLIIGQGGQQGLEIDNLRCNFDVVKNSSKNPNRSRIRIYNLSPNNRKMLEKPDVRCIFKAGYSEEDGALEVYQGDVALVFSTYDRADVITEIQLGEGFKAIRDVMISLSYKGGVTSKKVLQDIASKMKITLSMPDDVPQRSWNNGLAFHGAGRQGLDKICAATGLSWSIQGGALQIVRSGGNTNRTVFDLGADSGLIGHPERTRQGKQEVAVDPEDPKAAKLLKARSRQITATQEEDGWRIRSLLLPTLLPSDRVKLSSRTVEGVFTIKDIRHFGDTHQGDWITELKVVDPKSASTDTRAQTPAGKTQVRQSNVGGMAPPPDERFKLSAAPKAAPSIPGDSGQVIIPSPPSPPNQILYLTDEFDRVITDEFSMPLEFS
jgi:hypothetical protein